MDSDQLIQYFQVQISKLEKRDEENQIKIEKLETREEEYYLDLKQREVENKKRGEEHRGSFDKCQAIIDSLRLDLKNALADARTAEITHRVEIDKLAEYWTNKVLQLNVSHRGQDGEIKVIKDMQSQQSWRQRPPQRLPVDTERRC